ncbi:MAG TPA: glycoside hydrolase family 6 protein [Longimicrobiales bacterium]|nr:glycoside hydrolase family 6 protein [Longimicrobiales bacterium]
MPQAYVLPPAPHMRKPWLFILALCAVNCGGDSNTSVDEVDVVPVRLPGARLWIDSTSTVWRAFRAETDPAAANLLGTIATQPIVPWYTEPDQDIDSQVNGLVARIRGSGALPVFALYAIPNRDCGSYASGGAANGAQYLAWINRVARGIGGRSAVVILEPDALLETECLSGPTLTERYDLLRLAVSALKTHAATSVYIDAGNPDWESSQEVASRLKRAGIDQADGFSLNVSSYWTTSQNLAYGNAISALVGGKHFIIDTSRNGNGAPAIDDICNAPGLALGANPTTATGIANVDAFLWVKTPGESDGDCKGGPPAGDFWRDYALQLVRNRK